MACRWLPIQASQNVAGRSRGGRGGRRPEATGSLIDQSVVPRRDGFTLPTGYVAVVFFVS